MLPDCLYIVMTLHERIRLSVCNSGYYKAKGTCVLCPGNTIKKLPGNTENCLTDQSCNGITRVPNEGHTDCGNQKFCNYINGF